MQTLEEHANSVCHYKQYDGLIFAVSAATLDSYGALGSSDVVILLHGFPTSSYDWSKVRH